MTRQIRTVFTYTIIFSFWFFLMLYLMTLSDDLDYQQKISEKQFSNITEQQWLQFYKQKEMLYAGRRRRIQEYCATQPRDFSRGWNSLLWVTHFCA